MTNIYCLLLGKVLIEEIPQVLYLKIALNYYKLKNESQGELWVIYP
ncbi:hypothetical protein IRB23SM22_21920 [Alkalibacterium sp. s-m-22]